MSLFETIAKIVSELFELHIRKIVDCLGFQWDLSVFLLGSLEIRYWLYLNEVGNQINFYNSG